jgi:ABC-type polar amino acid transport system ATPase subunit
MIAVDKLVKRFGSHTVLDGISLSVNRGEVAVVVGPSGGGKSTFLRCLNGLEDFQAGSVRVAELEVTPRLLPAERQRRVALIRRRTGMVFQQFNLFPHQTVLENIIEAPVHVLHISHAAAVADAERLLKRVGLEGRRDQMPDTLSGGQQQRVAIARALAMQPEVMLFDEPTSALDPRMAAEVEAVIADLAESGQTMIVATHSMRLARRSATTIHVFEEGRVLESGPPEQIFIAPREAGTLRFLAETDGR